MKSPLVQYLEKKAKASRWRKKPRVRGKLIEKTLTKKGHWKLIIKEGEYEKKVFVLKKNPKLFQQATALAVGKSVVIVGRAKYDHYYVENTGIRDSDTLETRIGKDKMGAEEVGGVLR